MGKTQKLLNVEDMKFHVENLELKVKRVKEDSGLDLKLYVDFGFVLLMNGVETLMDICPLVEKEIKELSDYLDGLEIGAFLTRQKIEREKELRDFAKGAYGSS